MEVLTDDGNIVNIDFNTALPKRFFFEERFPFPECHILEFKRSFRDEQKRRYIETGCAFLNSDVGGHIVFGVVDHDRTIIGCRMNVKDIDDFNIFADHIHNQILYTDGNIISPKCIQTRIEKITKNRYVCIVSFFPEKNKIYQLTDGSIYRRINASNRRFTGTKLYHQHEVKILVQKMENEKQKAVEKHERDCRIQIQEYINELEEERENKKVEIQQKEKQVIIDINQIMYNYYKHPINQSFDYSKYILPLSLISATSLLLFITSLLN
jgi:hypothetical protein